MTAHFNEITDDVTQSLDCFSRPDAKGIYTFAMGNYRGNLIKLHHWSPTIDDGRIREQLRFEKMCVRIVLNAIHSDNPPPIYNGASSYGNDVPFDKTQLGEDGKSCIVKYGDNVLYYKCFFIPDQDDSGIKAAYISFTDGSDLTDTNYLH